MGNTIGLPACPRGNTLNVTLKFTQYGGAQPINLTGVTLAFIANRQMDQKSAPEVFVEWSSHTDPVNGVTQLQVLDSVTSGLDPGSYYFNITGRDLYNNVLTYAAGTWPITAVPGLISGAA